MGQQQDFRTDHAALAGVVAVLAVILAVQLFAGAIGGSGHGRLSGAALDLGYMKMIQCDAQSPPNSSFVVFVDGLHKQALDLRQGEGLFSTKE